MNGLMELLDSARLQFMTADEKIKYEQMWANTLKSTHLENIDFTKLTIGEFFSNRSMVFWEEEQDECIKAITEVIEDGLVFSEPLLIGFISAWINSDIQHPKVEELVKHYLKHDLLKFPINTPVSEYLSQTNTRPNHRPKKGAIKYLDTLMHYFDIQSINGTAQLLGIDRQTVKDHLKKLVGESYHYSILIDKNFKFYNLIQGTYTLWVINNEKK